jgi:predicted tellurium resistance membrane protein TerC
MTKKRTFLRSTTTIFIVIYAIISMTSAGISCHRSTKTGFEINKKLAIYMFLLLGLIFLATGITMICQTRSHFKAFYQEYRCYIWFATIFLTVPLWLRCFVIQQRNHDTKFTRYNTNHYPLANNIVIIFTTLVPIVS